MDRQAARQKNLEAVHSYLALEGADRAEGRLALYTDDIEVELPFTGSLIWRESRFVGRERVARLEREIRAKRFPDWAFADPQVYQTQDDSVILVFCRGEGDYRQPGQPPRRYQNDYILWFQLRDGKICRLRQFQNPCAIARMLEQA